MKNLLLIGALVCLGVLAACEVSEDPGHGFNCYKTVMVVKAGSGEIVSNETTWEFVYEEGALAKWRSLEGTRVERNGAIVTVSTVVCLECDRKGGK